MVTFLLLINPKNTGLFCSQYGTGEGVLSTLPSVKLDPDILES